MVIRLVLDPSLGLWATTHAAICLPNSPEGALRPPAEPGNEDLRNSLLGPMGEQAGLGGFCRGSRLLIVQPASQQ